MVKDYVLGQCVLPPTGELTASLFQWNAGDEKALDRVISEIYPELRRRAARFIKGWHDVQTLPPTALIHEVYLRLLKNRAMRFENRAQFFWFMGRLMREILVDRARARLRLKRGGGVAEVPIDLLTDLPEIRCIDGETLIDLNRALCKLTTFDARLASIVELRFFSGLRLEEIASVLGWSTTTIKREWRIAKRWLARELGMA